jgi:hypothetical protein
VQAPTRLIDPPHARGIMLMPTRYIEPKHTGWTVFAGLMLLLAGTLNIVWGFLELLNDYYFSGDTLAVGYHSLWGWLWIGIGVFQLVLVPLVLAHNPAGVFFAIIATGLNALGHVLGFGSRPGWSIGALVIDALVLFALVSYGFRVRDVSSPFRS